jgi:hypothetical protein
MLKYETEKENERQFLALTGLMVHEFEALLSPFAAMWHEQMRQRTMDGRVRMERAHSDYANSPLPTGAEKLLFILVYLKQAPTQTVQGRLFGMSQSNANKWIHLLLPILNATLTQLGERPARHATALTQRWQTLQPSPTEPSPTDPPPTDEEASAATAPTPALFFTTEPNNPYSGPPVDRLTFTVAGKSATRLKMCCWWMRTARSAG